MLTTGISNYLAEIQAAMSDCGNALDRAIRMVRENHKAGKTLWVLGNGGSLAVAQHFAQDLTKLCGIRAQCLNDPSVITAYTNDEKFENSYYGPLSILRRKGELVMIFSCSGNSRNYEKLMACGTIPLLSVVGTNGGFLKLSSNHTVHVQSDNYQICETAFCVIADLIIKNFMEKRRGEK